VLCTSYLTAMEIEPDIRKEKNNEC